MVGFPFSQKKRFRRQSAITSKAISLWFSTIAISRESLNNLQAQMAATPSAVNCFSPRYAPILWRISQMLNIHQAREIEFESSTDGARHSLPRRRNRGTNSARSAQLYESEFAAIGNMKIELDAVEVVKNFVRELDDRIQTLAAGKGGPLYPLETVFTVQCPWISGYLGLVVDEERGEVRRSNYDAPVCFLPDSVAWTVFLAAWNGGESGCSQEIWESREDLLQDPIREKAIRRDVSKKLRVLGIRLQLRQPPRLVECPPPRR
jgi:hypothetical protein